MKKLSFQERMNKGNAFIEENLVICCEELEEWSNTTILADGKVRELTSIIYQDGIDSFSLAVSMIKRHAISFVINSKK